MRSIEPRALLAALLVLTLPACGPTEPATSPTVDVTPAAPLTQSTAEAATTAAPSTASAAVLPAASPAPTATAAAPTATAPAGLTPAVKPVSGNAAQAQKLFEEARAAMSAGDIATACNKFEASLKLDFGLGTLMNLAMCVERQGDKVKACKLYGQAEAEAHNAGQTDREQYIRSKRTALCGP